MEESMQEHLKLLGQKVRDVVTGFTGVVTSISFSLYGCIQAVVTPDYDEKGGKQPEGRWVDVSGLQLLSKKAVLPVPTFVTVPGGLVQPDRPRKPMPR
jgi:hypothetical protein